MAGHEFWPPRFEQLTQCSLGCGNISTEILHGLALRPTLLAFADDSLSFFSITPALNDGATRLFKIFVVREVMLDLLLEAIMQVIDAFNGIVCIAVISRNADNLVINFTVVLKLKHGYNFGLQ